MCRHEGAGSGQALTRRRFVQVAAGVGAVTVVPGFRSALAASGPASDGIWLAGDFHCHTVLSHDVWGGPGDDNTGLEESYTLGWTAGEQIANAEVRGLDFLAITDHDRVDALRLPEYRSDRLTLVPGYEHSLAGGHAGVFVPDPALLPDIVRDADGSKNFDGDAALGRFVGLVRERGGLTVLNHPFYGNEDEGEAIAWGYSEDVSAEMDAVEVWNIGWPARHDTLPVADSDNYLSLPWWERELVRRCRIPAVGGSDNHYRSTAAIQGVGQPTTWVYARERSAAGVLEGVRGGRTFVAAQPPAFGGPRILLTAVEDWRRGRAAMVGGRLRALGPLQVQVLVENAPGHQLRLVSSGQVVGTATITDIASRHTFRVVLPPGGWLRAEVFAHPGLVMGALTSPIYAEGTAPPAARAEPTTGPPVGYGGELLAL